MNLYKVGNNIRDLRKKLLLTQEDLAQKLDVSSQAVSKWENGHCLPETQLLPLLAKSLGTTIDYLLVVDEEGTIEDILNTQKSIIIEPKIIRKGSIIIAGVLGDGNKTFEIWNEFERLENDCAIKNKKEDAGYELRMYDKNGNCDCLAGVRVEEIISGNDYDYKMLPDVLYAVFEIYPAKGYESQNRAMDKWLLSNSNKYKEFRLENKNYAIEHYDERFKGNEDPDSIVEIWIPVIKL